MDHKDNGNNSHVTLREFERERFDTRHILANLSTSLKKLQKSNITLTTEIKHNSRTLRKLERQIDSIFNKLSIINETDLPALKHHNIELSTKQKVIIGVIVAGISTLINLFEILVQSFFNH